MRQIQQFVLEHRPIVGGGLMCVALIVAMVYLVVLPEKAPNSPLVVQVIVQYGHSLCWLLLALAAGLFVYQKSPRLIAAVAYSALATYLVFIVTLMFVRAG